jgi:hypothetical protein
MIIFDNRIETTPEALWDLLISKNASLRGKTHTLANVDGESKSQRMIVMPDGCGAGWFACEIIHSNLLRLQVFAVKKFPDCLQYMVGLTWPVLETIKGQDYADVWVKSIPPKGFQKVPIFPILGELSVLAKKLNSNENSQADEKSKRRKTGKPHLLDDLWAWEQIYHNDQDPAEVKAEWLQRDGVKERNLIEPDRQFTRINHHDWNRT